MTKRRHAELFAHRDAIRFEHTLEVTEDDTDALGHVNNVVYVKWVQDIAGAHWRAAAAPEHLESVAWALVRHEIDYKAPAFPGDELTIRTWVGAASPVRYERHAEVVGADGRVHAKSLTYWAPIDPETGRLRKLPVEAHEPFYE